MDQVRNTKNVRVIEYYMKCPKCQSTDTKKVSVNDPAWAVGHQRCNNCGHQCHWNQFYDPPLMEITFQTGRKRVVIE